MVLGPLLRVSTCRLGAVNLHENTIYSTCLQLGYLWKI